MDTALAQSLTPGRTRRPSRNPSVRMSMAEWRTICPCQEHRTSGASAVRKAFRNSREILRSPYAALIFSVPIAFGAAGIPMMETEREIQTAVVPAAVRASVQDAASVMSFVDDPISMVREQLPLQLITPSIRRDFLSAAMAPDAMSLDLVKAEYFRTEIPFGAIIYREAKRYGLQPELVAAVVEAESDFRPKLLSNRNAHGLMQLIPSTGELMGAKDLLDPADNVRAGARYLRHLHDRFNGDEALVLAAYNAGPTAVRRFGGVPPFQETQNYLKRVSRSKAKFERRIVTRHSALVDMVSVTAE